MPDGALRILSIGLLALLYLFFLRSLRAVWVEVKAPPRPPAPRPDARRRTNRAARPPEPAPAKDRKERKEPALVLVEPSLQRGQRFVLTDEMTVGRAAGCSIVVDDSFASGVHTRVFRNGGQVLVEDLGSTNGTFVNDETVTGPRVLKRKDRLKIGSHVFEADW